MNQSEWIKWCETTMTVQLRNTAAPRKEIKSYMETSEASDGGVSLNNSNAFTPHIGIESKWSLLILDIPDEQSNQVNN